VEIIVGKGRDVSLLFGQGVAHQVGSIGRATKDGLKGLLIFPNWHCVEALGRELSSCRWSRCAIAPPLLIGRKIAYSNSSASSCSGGTIRLKAHAQPKQYLFKATSASP